MPISENAKSKFFAVLNSEEFSKNIQIEKEGREIDPYQYSCLQYWLQLESWTVEEGIYLIAGLDPSSVDIDLLERDISHFNDALPLDKSRSFQFDPIEVCDQKDFPGNDESYQSYLNAYEAKKGTLDEYRCIVANLTHILSRSVVGLGEPAIKNGFKKTYRPIQFMEWAKSIGWKISWIDSPTAIESGARFSTTEVEADKPLLTTERNTLLTIIAVLCKDAGYDVTKHAKTASLILNTASKMGLSIGETTIENHLKKIPDALGSRMK